MPLGFSGGDVYKDEFEFAKADYDKFIKSQNDTDMHQDPQANALEQDLTTIENDGFVPIGDWFFDKPKSPQVGKPEMVKPNYPTGQERLNDAFDQVEQQHRNTMRSLRGLNRPKQMASGFQKTSNIEGEGSDLAGPYDLRNLDREGWDKDGYRFDLSWERKQFDSYDELKKLMDDEYHGAKGMIVQDPKGNKPGEIFLKKKQDLTS